MKIKYFVISDIHSHYQAMINALNEKGFDSKNDSHKLIVLGDLFDRGPEAVKVLDYIYNLYKEDKAHLILGNHDAFLLDYLDEKYDKVEFNIKHNGFGKTLYQLSGVQPNNTNIMEIHNIINRRYPFLQSWLESFPYYLEIENYIFVHGGIDGSKLDWKTMSSRRDFVWSREINLPRVSGKIVVAGHHRVATIRNKTNDYHLLFLNKPELFDILYDDGKILIDRFVEVSNEINVLVLEFKA